ncbi:MAG: SRPBCC family protein [Planctomycetota bacterium]|jgi:ligand-binding SRPBCC domain-containing protein
MTVTITRSPRGGHRLETGMRLAGGLDAVFAFFADARNLERITPDRLRFHVLTPAPLEMREGLRIDYRLRLRGVPLRWQSEITAWDPPRRFVDEQRRGPYRWWVHEHLFEAVGPDATLVRDRVDYRAPGGGLVHRLLVAPDLRAIFAYRASVLRSMFGEATPSPAPGAAGNGDGRPVRR